MMCIRAFHAFCTMGAFALLCGCMSDLDPMQRQSKYKPYADSELFADGRAMRLPPEGTVAREAIVDDPALTSGENPDGGMLEKAPLAVDALLLARGRDRYDIYCAPCHGIGGDGHGIVSDKMAQRLPPTLVDDRLRAFPVGRIYRAISDGYGLMPSYHYELTPKDRWAVVEYVRALQRSQSARVETAPADVRARLEKESP